MSEDFIITIYDAIDLWDCIATMRIGAAEISVLSEYNFISDKRKYEFAIKGTKGRKVLAPSDEVCVVTFKDYSRDILLFTKRQIKIEAFVLLYKQLRNIENILLREKTKWLAEQRSVEASLDQTQPIGGMDDE